MKEINKNDVYSDLDDCEDVPSFLESCELDILDELYRQDLSLYNIDDEYEYLEDNEDLSLADASQFKGWQRIELLDERKILRKEVECNPRFG